jgi:hypothetical protein
MTYDIAEGRQKLSATWRLLAKQMVDLGYSPSDVAETMAGVALSWGLQRDYSPAEDRAVQAEEPDPRLPKVIQGAARCADLSVPR